MKRKRLSTAKVYDSSLVIWRVILISVTLNQILYSAAFLWTDNVFEISKNYNHIDTLFSPEQYGLIGLVIAAFNILVINSDKMKFLFPITIMFWMFTFYSFYISSGTFSPITTMMLNIVILSSIGFIISGGWSVNKKENTHEGGQISIKDK